MLVYTFKYGFYDRFKSANEYFVFKAFTFPLFNLTKRDMQDIAQSKGFSDLLNLTWFCHTPQADIRPCGVCPPCIFTIEEGMGRRVPLLGRIRYRFRHCPGLKGVLQKYLPFHRVLNIVKDRIQNFH